MIRFLYKEVVRGDREAVVSTDPSPHAVGQSITGPFDDVNEPAEVVGHDPRPVQLADGSVAEGGTVFVQSLRPVK